MVSWADTRQNQTPVNSPNRKTNVCVIARAPFLSLQLSLGSIKQKKCIKEFCVMEYLSLSVCRLKTTLPDQALPWQFRSSKAFNILSSHRERSHHKQLNSAWHLSRRWEMQKSSTFWWKVLPCRDSLGMEGDSAQSMLTNEHCTCCTRNAQGTGQFFFFPFLSSSSTRNKVAIATETLKKKLA